jgi:hypothetical protein
MFEARCAELNQAYDELEARTGIATGMRGGAAGRGGRLRRLIRCWRDRSY